MLIHFWLHFYLCLCIIKLFSQSVRSCDLQNAKSCSGHGTCEIHPNTSDSFCFCDDGWVGSKCDECKKYILFNETKGIWSHTNTSLLYPGEGYAPNMQCRLVLITQQFKYITLETNNITLECQYDHVHIYEGVSIHGVKMAAFSGISSNMFLSVENSTVIYFQSDAHTEKKGFFIPYFSSNCPNNCSEVGTCNDITGKCTCNPGFTGNACEVKFCPNNCTFPNGECNYTTNRCDCTNEWTGIGCDINKTDSRLIKVPTYISPNLFERAGHSAVIVGSSMWIFGGKTGSFKTTNSLIKYDITTNSWNSVTNKTALWPEPRYNHKAVALNDTVFVVLGGILSSSLEITDQLWAFDTVNEIWTNLASAPKPITSHSLVVRNPNKPGISAAVHSLFGFSEDGRHFNNTMIYNIEKNEWHVPASVPVFGARNNRVYLSEHTGVYYQQQDFIIVHGGLLLEAEDGIENEIQTRTKKTFGLNCTDNTLIQLADSHVAVSSHSSIIIGTKMFVLGGIVSNTSCFSDDLYSYDLFNDSWSKLNISSELFQGVMKHTAVVFGKGFFVVGGFNGLVLDQFLKFELGTCLYDDENICNYNGCHWCNQACIDPRNSTCHTPSLKLPVSDVNSKHQCACHDCDSSSCNAACSMRCRAVQYSSNCSFHDCMSCRENPICRWCDSLQECVDHTQVLNM